MLYQMIVLAVSIIIMVLVASLTFFAISDHDSNASEGGYNDSETCGRTKVMTGVGKILGGTNVAEGELPWQVSIHFFDEDNNRYFLCGGTLITRQWVVTAAHCFNQFFNAEEQKPVQGKEANGTIFQIGSIGSLSREGGKTSIVTKLIRHPDFNADSFENDVALLKCDRQLDLNDNVNIICLPNSTDEVIGGTAKVSGWGVQYVGGEKLSEELKQAIIKIIPNSDCKRDYNPILITSDMICAEAPEKDSCQGDSGGPLLQYKENRSELIGIISFGLTCGEQIHPGVYTRVASFVDWIKANVD